MNKRRTPPDSPLLLFQSHPPQCSFRSHDQSLAPFRKLFSQERGESSQRRQTEPRKNQNQECGSHGKMRKSDQRVRDAGEAKWNVGAGSSYIGYVAEIGRAWELTFIHYLVSQSRCRYIGLQFHAVPTMKPHS